jgi:transposase
MGGKVTASARSRRRGTKEVPAFVAHRERRKSPSKGKSDLADAIAIARVTARGDGLFSPHRSEAFQDLKLLSDHRDQLVRARTRIINRTHNTALMSNFANERPLVTKSLAFASQCRPEVP